MPHAHHATCELNIIVTARAKHSGGRRPSRLHQYLCSNLWDDHCRTQHAVCVAVCDLYVTLLVLTYNHINTLRHWLFFSHWRRLPQGTKCLAGDWKAKCWVQISKQYVVTHITPLSLTHTKKHTRRQPSPTPTLSAKD